jgi:cytochrome o ubiquinol oxidase subunit 1
MKKLARAKKDEPAKARDYRPIEVPLNSPIGFVTAFFAVVTGFALIWHIWWMAALGALGAFATLLIFAFRNEEEFEVSAETIAQFDRTHPQEVAL